MMGIAQQIHLLLLVIAHLGQLLPNCRRPFRPVRLVLDQPIVEQLVEQDWMTHQVLGCPPAHREHSHHALERTRILVKQRHIGVASGHHIGKLGKAREVLIRANAGRCPGLVRKLDCRLQCTLNQTCQTAARGLRARLDAPRIEHRAHPLCGGCRIRKSERAQVVGQCAFIRTATKGTQCQRAFSTISRSLGEDCIERVGHDRLRRLILRHEGWHAARSEQFRNAFDFRDIRRHNVRLRVVNVLQSVLEIAQEDIGNRQLLARLSGQNAQLRKRSQRLQRRFRTQSQIPRPE